MSITSTVSGALTSDLAKFAGKKFLESSFPQLYGLHKEYKGYKEERRKKETPENQKSEIQKNFESIDNEIKDTNVLLETEASIMGSQTVIMQQFLEEIKQIRKELLLGGGGGGIGPKGGPKTKAPQPQAKVFGNAAEAKKAGGGKYYDKNGRLQEMKPKPGGGFTSTFAKNIPEAKPSFLSKAGSLAKGVLNFAGRIAAPLAIAGLAYDIHNTTKEGIEKKMNDPLNDPGSFNKLLSGLFGGSKKKISAGEEKQNLSILNYKASNSITFKSDELKINAQTIVMTEDMIKLLKDLDAKSEAERNAAADAQDRNTAVTEPGGIGDRLRGRPAPPGSPGSQPSANAGEAGKNLTTVTAKKAGKSDKVGSAYASNFQGFLDDLEATGYQIKTLGGFSFRGNKNNPSMLSYHGMGAALDVNAATNPFHTRQTDMPRNVGEIAKAHGLGWGISFEDPMHFSAAKREGGSFDIAQQRMPGYASGTPYVPQTGVATVGELGSETIVGKDGIKKTAAGAHTMMLRKGESVIPAGEKRSATEIAAEYKNSKAFASGTKPTLDQSANENIQNFLNSPDIKYDPRMQMGLRNLGKNGKYGPEGNIIDSKGGAMHTVIDSTGERERILGGYMTPNAGGQKLYMNSEDEIKNKGRSISDYKNQIVVQTLGREIYPGDDNLKTILKHEVGHAAAQKYYDRGSLEENPELYARAQSVLGDAQSIKGGTSEEARQRLQDLQTRSETMTGNELEDWYRKIMEDTTAGFNFENNNMLDYLKNHEARTSLYNDVNKDIDRVAKEYYPEQALRIPEGSSIHMLDTMGQYK